MDVWKKVTRIIDIHNQSMPFLTPGLIGYGLKGIFLGGYAVYNLNPVICVNNSIKGLS